MLDSPGLRIAVRRDPPTVEDLRSTSVPDDPVQRRDLYLLERARGGDLDAFNDLVTSVPGPALRARRADGPGSRPGVRLRPGGVLLGVPEPDLVPWRERQVLPARPAALPAAPGGSRHRRAGRRSVEADVTAFLVALREGDAEHPPLAANSAARAVVAVRGFHRFLLREGLVTVDPARGVRPPAPPKRLPKAITVRGRRGAAGGGRGRRDPAGAARPGAARAALRQRRAHLRGGRPRRRRARPRVAARCGCSARAARSASCRSAPTPARRCRPTSSAAGRRWPRPGPGSPALFLNARGGRLSRQSAWTGAAGGRRAGRAAHGRSRRTRCGTPSPPTCSTAAPTSGSCRSCWATPSVTTTQVYTLVTVDRLREVYATSHPRAPRLIGIPGAHGVAA